MGARGLAEMAQDNKLISVADAAHFLAIPNVKVSIKQAKQHIKRAKLLINQAWKQRFITLYGVPAGEPVDSEPVEIPFNEGGRVDCKKSRIVRRSARRIYA